jgi:hypothetical protein
MADRNFNRKQALEKEVKEIYFKVAIGASGAPTLDAVNSKGVASISRVSAGLYSIVLQDKYNALMDLSVHVVTPSAEQIQPNMVSEDVASTKIVQIRCTAAGIAADPASGDTLQGVLQLKNTSVI